MFSSNHLFYNCLRNSFKISNNIQNKCFYSNLKSLSRFLDNKNRRKLWAECRAIRRLLTDNRLVFWPKTLSANNLLTKSVVLSNDSQNKNPKTNGNQNNDKNKDPINRNYDDNDEDKEDEDNEPKSSLLAKAVVWMLSGFDSLKTQNQNILINCLLNWNQLSDI